VTAAVVPVKALDRAKGRLASVLTDDERRRLTLAMLEDVLAALNAVTRLDPVTVVSSDAEVLTLAGDLTVEPIEEPPGTTDMNAALDHARDTVAALGADSILVVLSDVPAVSPTDIESVLDALSQEGGAVLCPSISGGTSALALRPPDAIPFRFGEGSFAAHQSEVEARGLSTRVLQLDSLARDLDGPSDLLHFASTPTDTATHRLIAEMRLSQRLQPTP
jgi:2-phospho-L-lactate guanylyltransferase